MARAAPRGATRVLVVEDELLIAMDIEQMLTNLDYEVIGPTGRLADALRLIEAEPPDIAVLDVKLRNGENSYGAATALLRRSIPFAFMTAYGAEGLAPEFAGCPVLHKPFRDSELARCLQHLCLSATKREGA